MPDGDSAHEATAWFEQLYAASAEGRATVPWDNRAPARPLVEWAEAGGVDGTGCRALVVGCGFGEDAEHVASLGFETVAFDIAPTAVRGAAARHPGSAVSYVVADLLGPPAAWTHAYDLVLESRTVQSLPPSLHAQAARTVGRFVAPGGTLLVLAARAPGDAVAQGPPWPLARAEITAFGADGLTEVRVDDLGPYGWRAELHRREGDQSG